VCFNILLLLFSSSYLFCIFGDAGSVPLWFGSEMLDNDVERNITFPRPLETNRAGNQRFCTKCQRSKPDRSHHCRLCNRCVLKMDHHCPWINNCVGWGNYKAFILFISYTLLLTLFISATLINIVIKFDLGVLNSEITQTLILLIISGLLAVMMIFFCGLHIILVSRNLTTIELCEKKSSFHTIFFKEEVQLDVRAGALNPYDLSKRKNFEQVFGTNVFLWFLPLHTSLGDGCYYPIRENLLSSPSHVSNSSLSLGSQ